MHRPIQSDPVRRTMPGQPAAGAIAGAQPSGEGIAASQHGVDASQAFSFIPWLNKGALPLPPPFAPHLEP